MGEYRFCSDIHFNHKNVLSYDKRDFETIEEHDNYIIEQWNNTVEYDDIVWILGDVSWYGVKKTIEILNSLNGSKNLIIGNHDKKFLKNKDFRDCFNEIAYYKELPFENDKFIVLCHYPIAAFNGNYYGNYHFYGHVHDSWEYKCIEKYKRERDSIKKPLNMYNVYLPKLDYAPRTAKEIILNNY